MFKNLKYEDKKFKKESEDVSNRFEGEEKELIDKTISLIYSSLNNCLHHLDTKEFAVSRGFSEEYSSCVEKIFSLRGFNSFIVKDFDIFSNLAEYGENYLKLVKGLDGELKSLNIKVFKELYEKK